MTAPQILRWMLTADAAQSNTPLLEPAAEAGSEHQLSANIATFVTLFTQELCERTKMRCDRTDGAFLWHTRQNHLLVDAVSHDWAPFPEKSGRRGSQDYIESNPRVCRTLKGFGTWLAYSGAQEIVPQEVGKDTPASQLWVLLGGGTRCKLKPFGDADPSEGCTGAVCKERLFGFARILL